MEFAKQKLSEKGLNNLDVVVVMPPEQYILAGFGINVCKIMVYGGLQDITPEVLDEIRNGLSNGKYSAIIMSDLARRLPVYRYVEELSMLTGRPIIEIRTISFDGIRLYEAILTYNLAKILMIYEKKEASYSMQSNVIIIYALAVIFGIIAFIEGILLRRRL